MTRDDLTTAISILRSAAATLGPGQNVESLRIRVPDPALLDVLPDAHRSKSTYPKWGADGGYPDPRKAVEWETMECAGTCQVGPVVRPAIPAVTPSLEVQQAAGLPLWRLHIEIAYVRPATTEEQVAALERHLKVAEQYRQIACEAAN